MSRLINSLKCRFPSDHGAPRNEKEVMFYFLVSSSWTFLSSAPSRMTLPPSISITIQGHLASCCVTSVLPGATWSGTAAPAARRSALRARLSTTPTSGTATRSASTAAPSARSCSSSGRSAPARRTASASASRAGTWSSSSAWGTRSVRPGSALSRQVGPAPPHAQTLSELCPERSWQIQD